MPHPSTPRCRPPAPTRNGGVRWRPGFANASCRSKSTIHSRFGAAAAKSRLTRSGGRSPDRSGRVVRNRRLRRTPCRPTRRISRSTVQRGPGPNRSAMPASRRKRCHTLRARPAAQIAVMEDPIDLHQQRGVAYRPCRGRSDPRGLVAQRGDLAAVPVQHPPDRLDPNRSLWSSMKMITTAVAGRALARRKLEAAKRISLARFSSRQAPGPTSTIGSRCRRHHPRS